MTHGNIKEGKMTKVLACREVGVDCDLVLRGETEEEILKKAIEHAAQEHNIADLPPEAIEELRAAIRDA